MVQDVEELRADLQVESLRDRRILNQRRIPREVAGTPQHVASRVAEGELRRRSERSRIKPLGEEARPGIRISHNVGAATGPTGHGAGERDGVRFTGTLAGDACKTPTSKHVICE